MSYFNVDRGNVWKFSVLRGNAWGFSISRGNTWKFVVGVITDRTAPVLQSAIVPSDGLTLDLTYDEILDTNSVPVVSDFDIGLLSGVVVDAVAISGAVVTLTLSRTILEGETLTVGYFAGSNPIQDDYGNQAANLSNEPVTNNSTVDATAPVIQSAVIPADGLTLAMTYDEALDETSVPAFGDFSLSGTSSVVASVGVSGSVVTLTMDTAILQGETVLLDYTAGANPIRDESENNAANLTNQATTNNSEVASYPAILDDGNTMAWYDALENVTKDGSDFVSVWGDKSGNGNDLLQATGTNQPLFDTDEIIFGGIDEFLKTVPFNLDQPTFIYMVARQISWTNGDYLFDGDQVVTQHLRQDQSSPRIQAYAGTFGGQNANMAIGSDAIIRCLFNGGSSKLQINETTATTGNFGNDDADGFTLGVRGDAAAGFSNIAVKEPIIRKVVDAAQDEQDIYDYLAAKYSIS